MKTPTHIPEDRAKEILEKVRAEIVAATASTTENRAKNEMLIRAHDTICEPFVLWMMKEHNEGANANDIFIVAARALGWCGGVMAGSVSATDGDRAEAALHMAGRVSQEVVLAAAGKGLIVPTTKGGNA